MVDTIMESLSLSPPDELLLLVMFGSQVNNTETPESDLDILYVARAEPKQHKRFTHDVMGKARTDMKINMIPRAPEAIKRRGNLYGMLEYDVLRKNHGDKSIILYRSRDACSVLDSILAGGVGGCNGDKDGHNEKDVLDVALCARQWLDESKRTIAHGSSLVEEISTSHNRNAEEVCNTMYDSITCSINACLLHHNILFPFTRDLRVLRDMLPTRSHMPLNFDALRKWGAHRIKHRKSTPDERLPTYEYTDDDVRAAAQTAQSTYDFVSREMSSSPPMH